MGVKGEPAPAYGANPEVELFGIGPAAETTGGGVLEGQGTGCRGGHQSQLDETVLESWAPVVGLSL